MRTLSAIVQSLLIAIALGLLITVITTGNTGYFFGLLYVQLFLGPWQYFSSLFNLHRLKKQPKWFRDGIRIHLGASTLYLTSLFLMSDGTMSKALMIIMVFSIPWLLGIFYFLLTIKRLRSPKRTGSFLPHVSF
ncbi:MAG: hypothetical protein AAFX87_09715 [Bacteroidota bacterium]